MGWLLESVDVGLLVVIAMVFMLFCAPSSSRADGTIVDEWADVTVPPAPKLSEVSVSAGECALLILDIQNQNCNAERRPRCVASLRPITELLGNCRAKDMTVVYTLTSNATPQDIRGELTPRPGDPVVKASVDKFHGTELEQILNAKQIKTVILVGTSAHGAVLHTATGAAMRGLQVVVPVDGMSATEPYAEQYTAWHLANSPGTRRRAVLTKTSMIKIQQ